jgi:glycerate 2-kinase
MSKFSFLVAISLRLLPSFCYPARRENGQNAFHGNGTDGSRFSTMKIIIAPDSFKESLSAFQAAEQIEAGFREIFKDADYISLPMADGGEGTVEAMVAATAGRIVAAEVTGPLGVPVQAFYGVNGDGETAVIEMAAASGLALVPVRLRDPMKTTSFGTGELIRKALDAGLRSFVVGIGGSATNDAGAGMLQALGAGLYQKDGQEIGLGGEALSQLHRIDARGLDPRLKQCTIQVACDVDNPLIGPKGASAVFGPQKGATPEMVSRLDENLAHFARLVARDLQKEIATVAGAGAAGGMGGALLAFLDGLLRPGIEIVIEAVGLEAHLQGASLVITGEGRMDGQTIHGKAPVGVARLARQHGIPVIGIAGSLSAEVGMLYDHGLDAVFSVLERPCTLPEALAEAADNLRRTARNIAATIRLARIPAQ